MVSAETPQAERDELILKFRYGSARKALFKFK